MDKMKMETPDMAQVNIEKIGALFPNVITETVDADGKPRHVINFDLLKQMLSSDVLEGDEAYEFTWVGKKASIVEANKPIRKTLRPCKEESKDWDTTEHLYIEGDNLDVLKLLQESYLGKIKLIYIDPPYNTGHDFIYNDRFEMDKQEYDQQTGLFDEDENKNFVENNDSNPRFHSDWCSMIYPRLLLSRNLLTDDGLIFVSIDGNEQDSLKKICDEVFGATNYLTCVSRATGTPTGGGFDGLVNEIDYILIYAKDITAAHINGLPMTEEDAKIYDQTDDRGRFLTRPLRRTGGEDKREDRPTMYFPIEAPDGTDVYPIGPTGYESRWICSPDTVARMQTEGLLAWKQVERDGKLSWQVYQKFYLENRTKAPGNLWNDVEGNKKATRDIRSIFDSKKVFDYPKPLGLMKKIIQIGSDKNSLIMDFFSGSATTANAVIKCNAEDGGARRYIMVQLPEITDEGSEAKNEGYKNICEIGKERIRRAGDQLIAEAGLMAQDLDIGFRVLKLDDTNMKNVYYSADEYNQGMLIGLESNIKDDRTDLDLLFGCLLEWGLPLSLPYTSETVDGCVVHTYNGGDLIACFNDNVPESVVREIAGRKPLRVVFRDSSFASSPEKINVEEIFKLIAPGTSVKVI